VPKVNKSSKIDNENRTHLGKSGLRGFLGNQSILGAVDSSVEKRVHVDIRIIIKIESRALSLKIREKTVKNYENE
jgi:hypothetical protein